MIEDEHQTDDESDASLYSDSAQLRAIMAPKVNTSKSTAESSDLLSQIASDFNEDEDTSAGVSEKLAEIVNKRFSTSLGEEKLKEKLGQYLRPDNCANANIYSIWRCVARLSTVI